MASRKEEKERLRAQRLAAEAQTRSTAQRRLMLGYVLAGFLGLAVIVGLVLVIASGGSGGGGDSKGCGNPPDNAHIKNSGGSCQGLEPDGRAGTTPPPIQLGILSQAAKAAHCVLRENLPNEGNTHVPDSTSVTYKTNPPTSGNHNPVPADDGAYLTPVITDPNKFTSSTLNIRNFVHSLEHGRIEIQYKSSLPEADQLALKGVFDEDPAGMLMFPNDTMPYEVAATAWQQLLGCPTYNEHVLDAIRDFRDTYRGHGPETAIPINL
jgi:hypothetical protein